MHGQDITKVPRPEKAPTAAAAIKGYRGWSSQNKAPHKVSDQREQRIPFTPAWCGTGLSSVSLCGMARMN